MKAEDQQNPRIILLKRSMNATRVLRQPNLYPSVTKEKARERNRSRANRLGPGGVPPATSDESLNRYLFQTRKAERSESLLFLTPLSKVPLTI